MIPRILRITTTCSNYVFGVYAISALTTRGQPESDKEQREQHGRRQRDKDHRGKDEERKRQRHHYEFDKFMRRKDETKWGKGYCQDRAKKEGHHHGYSYCPDGGDKLGKEDRDDLSNRKERLRNKVSEKVSMRWRGRCHIMSLSLMIHCRTVCFRCWLIWLFTNDNQLRAITFLQCSDLCHKIRFSEHFRVY